MKKQSKFKKTLFFILILTLFFIPRLILRAETVTIAIVNGNSVNIRTDAGYQPGTSQYYPNVMAGSISIKLNAGHTVTILSSKSGTDGYTWNNIQFTYDSVSYTGYIRSDFITTTTYDITDDPTFDAYLATQGFPQSYWLKLKDLHAQHPNWTFQALQTGLEWNSAVEHESYLGMSVIDSSEEAYRSTEPGSYDWDTDTWYHPTNENNWYGANSNVVAYYLDPRNFLNISNILMFESLSYQSVFQTQTIVQKILDNTFMSSTFNYNGGNKSYAETFIEAATGSSVSPIHLASRARQELGASGSSSVSGGGFIYNGQTYSGLYNFYNIGASSGADAVYRGLVWANGGEIGTTLLTTYNRPWTNPYLSITGGASYIGSKYIQQGQNTIYLEKFNVSPTATNSTYTHQYMTNIRAPKSESSTSYNAYSSYNLLSEALVFIIPVYNNMPTSTSLPTVLGNPNNYLSSIRINDITIPGFNRETLTYDYYISSSVPSVGVNATKISSSATITSNTSSVTLTDVKTVVPVTVRAENGTVRTYTVNIIKSDEIPPTVSEIINNLKLTSGDGYLNGFALNTDASTINTDISKISSLVVTSITDTNGIVKTTGNIVTGDNISITSKGETVTYKAIIYGDVDGDGSITIKDLLSIQKTLLGSKTLSGSYAKAADPSKDGSITIKDLLKVQKHILGASIIAQ